MRKGIAKQHKEIVDYIVRQRKAGHPDGKIRTRMEIHGHTPENLNLYFQLADEHLQSSKVMQSVFSFLLVALVLGALVVTAQQTGMTAAVATTLTGAPTWSWSWSGFGGGYDCGDDYPADADDVMDLSDCVSDTSTTEDYLFCYVNNSVTSDEISPDGSNDDWYSTNVGEDVSAVSSIDTVALLESAYILPWSAATESYDNVDCFSWDHGATRTEDWHQCNASDTTPPNLVFYYTDAADGSNVSYGGVSTELSLNSSYYLCYDELECTTETSACSAGSYCVGRLDSETGSSWYPCDTTLDADYYRCCTGGCDAKEMMCGEYVGSDTRSAVEFDECSSDGTSGCCSAATDCVYDGECYSEDETITHEEITLGVCGGSGPCIEGSVETYTFVCSDEHWCPEGFEYDADDLICIPSQAACYDASDSAYCNYIFGTDDTEDWEADTEGSYGCVDPSSTGLGYYNTSCIYSGTYGGVDYYFYQDITWY